MDSARNFFKGSFWWPCKRQMATGCQVRTGFELDCVCALPWNPAKEKRRRFRAVALLTMVKWTWQIVRFLSKLPKLTLTFSQKLSVVTYWADNLMVCVSFSKTLQTRRPQRIVLNLTEELVRWAVQPLCQFLLGFLLKQLWTCLAVWCLFKRTSKIQMILGIETKIVLFTFTL